MIRKAEKADLSEILAIYNQGIEDGIATFEIDMKDQDFIEKWFERHQGRYAVLVATDGQGKVTGWASINPYNTREAYRGVGELSVYVHREHRGKGVGQQLLKALEDEAKNQEFYKLVLFTFPINKLGQGLYDKLNYREVGVFKNQGRLGGSFVDVVIMEKLLFDEEYYMRSGED